MATIDIWNYFSLDAQGETVTGKHGTITDLRETPTTLTVTPTVYRKIGTLANDSAATLWDEDAGDFNTFEFLHFWADQRCYLQLVSEATNVVLKLLAKAPFTLSTEYLLAAEDTTIIGGSEPSATAMDSIVLGNYSGVTINYKLALVD